MNYLKFSISLYVAFILSLFAKNDVFAQLTISELSDQILITSVDYFESSFSGASVASTATSSVVSTATSSVAGTTATSISSAASTSATLATTGASSQTPITPTPTTNPCLRNPCGQKAVCVLNAALQSGYNCQCRIGYYQQNSTATLQNDQSCQAAKYFTGNISINTAFNNNLNDPNNVEGKKIRNQAKLELEKAIRNSSDTAQNFLSVVIEKISQKPGGGITISFYAVYGANAAVLPAAIQSTVENNVQSIDNYNVTQVAAITQTNECQLANDPCSGVMQECQDTNDGYTCKVCTTEQYFNSSTKKCTAKPIKSCPSPCLNGGTCQTSLSVPTCSCTQFFTGSACESLSTLTIILITSGSTVLVLVVIALVVCLIYKKRQRPIRSGTNLYENSEDGKGHVNNYYEMATTEDYAEVDAGVPKRPYAGVLGGNQTTVIYDSKQALIRQSRIFEE
ncbi:uncharacterized protein TRIADDRAFT_52796 [Trichoplax adhaerens]|uniref:EGF-like domain-containing protein n=1 Tax=Trichoplax adhaerens TaxID=10228 RepID=B3RKC6_TRIAD|nr:predicted protein [Trichoplax adhaerens]EDV29176.1 predicted protein [Trichoplax adhaerens]|eukprot:XP_002108378.1 predicted protein [Trichoplax adhaerens]